MGNKVLIFIIVTFLGYYLYSQDTQKSGPIPRYIFNRAVDYLNYSIIDLSLKNKPIHNKFLNFCNGHDTSRLQRVCDYFQKSKEYIDIGNLTLEIESIKQKYQDDSIYGDEYMFLTDKVFNDSINYSLINSIVDTKKADKDKMLDLAIFFSVLKINIDRILKQTTIIEKDTTNYLPGFIIYKLDILTIIIIFILLLSIYLLFRKRHKITSKNSKQENIYHPVKQEQTVETRGATEITANSAKLNAFINSINKYTNYRFCYGLYEESRRIHTELKPITNQNNPIEVWEIISNLKPGKKYEYFIIASNDSGNENGLKVCFNTSEIKQKPLVETRNATHITTNSARLNAIINPNNMDLDTGYCFYYALREAGEGGYYTEKRTIKRQNNDIKVDEIINDLNPDTEYKFYIIAENSSGKSPSSELYFQTLEIQPIKEIFYFASPNEDGSFSLEKAQKSFIKHESIYAFTKITSNRATFVIEDDESAFKLALSFPDMTLYPVCKNLNDFNKNASRIKTKTHGEAELIGDKWKMTKHAEIMYE